MGSKVQTRVPVIDIAPFLNGNREEQEAVAREVDRTNREIGFFVITGHGFDRELLARWFDESKRFFEGDPERKNSVLAPKGQQQGYHGHAQSQLAAGEGQKTPPDLREYFMLGQLDVSGGKFVEGNAPDFHRPNRWPEGNDGFRQAGEAYYRAMEQLGSQLMNIFAMGLGLPQDWFVDKFDHHFSILSSIYYPMQKETPLPGQLRAGAHTDYGSLTILAPTDAPGGLQVRTLEGEWADVPYVPGAFVINIGDMMQRWTNDRWLSNWHRVVNPAVATPPKPRQSVAFFMHPNHDALIEGISTSQGKNETAKYAPITAGSYMREKELAISSRTPKK